MTTIEGTVYVEPLLSEVSGEPITGVGRGVGSSSLELDIMVRTN